MERPTVANQSNLSLIEDYYQRWLNDLTRSTHLGVRKDMIRPRIRRRLFPRAPMHRGPRARKAVTRSSTLIALATIWPTLIAQAHQRARVSRTSGAASVWPEQRLDMDRVFYP
jgi:hypothetical protein